MAAGDLTQGKRYPDGEYELEPGGYAKHTLNHAGELRTCWWVHTPSGQQGMLVLHDVAENEDGTITIEVKPAPPDDPGNRNSILFRPDSAGHAGWHGYIDAGEWREI